MGHLCVPFAERLNMTVINATVCGQSEDRKQLSGEFENDGAYKPGRFKKTKVEFRLYPIPSFTGVCKNGVYEKALQSKALHFIRKKYKTFNYRIGGMRECHGRVPDGYNSKYLELPVYFEGSWKGKDEALWFSTFD
jgi:hypothetical protein